MRLRGLQAFDAEVAEGDGVVVACEADVAGFAVDAGRFGFDAGVVEGVEVGVEDFGAVEGDFDLIATDFDLLGVPLAGGAEEAAFGAEDVVEGAVDLVGGEGFAGFGFVAVGVDDLEFDAVFGAVAAEGGAEGDAVVACGGEFEFEAEGHVAILFLGEEIAAFALFADDVAIDDFVVFDGALPVGEVFAVVDAGEAFFTGGEGLIGFIGADFADEDVAPADFAAVGLELDGAFGVDGVGDPTGRWGFGFGGFGIFFAVGEVAGFFVGEEVFEDGVFHDDFAVEGDGDAFTDHFDVEGVPLADGFVDELEGVFAFGVFVVPEAAGAEGLAEGDGFFVFFGEVPDLNLGDAAEVDAAVAEREHFVVDPEFEVAVVFVGGEVEAFAVVDEFVIFDFPVGVEMVAFVVAFGVEEAAFDGFLFVGGFVFGGHVPEVGGVLGAPAVPTGEVFAVEERSEAGRGFGGEERRGAGQEGGGEERGELGIHGGEVGSRRKRGRSFENG